ncbi:hypothetical protein [Flavobacterium limi]|uniref:hypothetical protein n=1 Tax=Flavobacterium limi TaxID=2045105 RepID=UPI0013D0DCB7|nr:hypothetical protein [Flavobacterium limi]
MGAFALLSTTLFSCTADEYETHTKKEVEKTSPITPTYADGPGDDPVIPPPPK